MTPTSNPACLGALWLGVMLASALLNVPAAGAADAEVRIEHMTWIEIRDAIATGRTTAIIPTGGTEQNGTHMVTGKHNFIVGETARRIAATLGDALVAPVIGYVPEGDIDRRQGHMAYAGTISVPDSVYQALLESAAASFKAHGFKTIVLLGDSGGNIAPQRALAAKLTQAWARDGVIVINAEGYYGANGGDAFLLSDGETAATIGTHAGIRDTSELMAVLPSGVDLKRVRKDAMGATGDAARASATRGEKLIAMKVEAAVAEIRKAQSGQKAAAQRGAGLLDRLWR